MEKRPQERSLLRSLFLSWIGNTTAVTAHRFPRPTTGRAPHCSPGLTVAVLSLLPLNAFRYNHTAAVGAGPQSRCFRFMALFQLNRIGDFLFGTSVG